VVIAGYGYLCVPAVLLWLIATLENCLNVCFFGGELLAIYVLKFLFV